MVPGYPLKINICHWIGVVFSLVLQSIRFMFIICNKEGPHGYHQPNNDPKAAIYNYTLPARNQSIKPRKPRPPSRHPAKLINSRTTNLPTPIFDLHIQPPIPIPPSISTSTTITSTSITSTTSTTRIPLLSYIIMRIHLLHTNNPPLRQLPTHRLTPTSTPQPPRSRRINRQRKQISDLVPARLEDHETQHNRAGHERQYQDHVEDLLPTFRPA